MVNPQFDCIVVGAGPAGTSAARRLALSGKRVLILEQNRLPRRKCCAGGLTPKVGRLLDFDWEAVVEQEAQKACFTYKGTKAHIPLVPPLSLKMVNRDRFDDLLLKKALEAGAGLWEGATLRELEIHGDGVRVRTHREEAAAAVVVGADGALSQVARLSGLRQGRQLGIGLCVEVPFPLGRDLSRRGTTASMEEAGGRRLEPGQRPAFNIRHPIRAERPPGEEVWGGSVQFDFGGVSEGYRWVFPHGEYLNVGLFTAAARPEGLRSSLERFLAGIGLVDSGSLRVQGHPIPCFLVQGEPLHGERVVLCGDAAGLADPLTGEGVPQAIESGYWAAEAIGRWLEGKGDLADYTRQIQETVGQEMYCAGRFARRLFTYPYLSYQLLVTNDQMASLFAQIMRGDLAYRELYGRLKRHPWGGASFLGRGVVESLSRWLG